MEEYLHSLRKQLKSFPPEEQAALMEEIRSHIESGENDPQMGKDTEQRKEKLMKEMGSPDAMVKGFKAVYQPNRLVDYLLVAIPFALYPLLNMLYLHFMPQMDLRADLLVHLPLIGIGWWRRSPLVASFWITAVAPGLLYMVTQGFWQSYWYFGLQTIWWAILFAGLLSLLGVIVWRNRRDLLTVLFALLPLCTLIMGVLLWIIHPMSYSSYNWADRSLLQIFLEIEGHGLVFYTFFPLMALFFLPRDRGVRWLALAAWALILGFGRAYLMDYQTGDLAMLAHWVYYLYVAVPAAMVGWAWCLDWNRRQHIKLAI